MLAPDYPGRTFTEDDIKQLTGYTTRGSNNPDYRPREKEVVVYNPHGFDVNPSELPQHHVEFTQMSLRKLCNIIGGYFRDAFHDFRGCEMRYDPKNGRPELGFLVFNLVFEYTTSSDANKFKALVRHDRPSDTIIDLEQRFRSLDLTAEAKGFLMKYMGTIEYDRDHKPFVQWNRYLEEKDLSGRSPSGYTVTSNRLVVTNVDLNKIVQDIWTDPKVKEADETAAINAWKRSHWKPIPNKQDEFETGAETDDEILAMCNVQRKYHIKVTFKGYQIKDPNGNDTFTTVPVNVSPNGQVRPSNTHDFDKYYVTVVVSDIAQIYHDLPYFSNGAWNNSNDFLLYLI